MDTIAREKEFNRDYDISSQELDIEFNYKKQAIRSLTDCKFKLDLNGNVIWLEDGDKPSKSEIEKATKAIELREAKNRYFLVLKRKFREEQEKGTMHSITLNKDVDARLEDIINIDNLIATLDDTATIDFRCADNSFKTAKRSDLESLRDEIVKHGFSLYQKKWQIENQIQKAKTVKELKSIEIDF